MSGSKNTIKERAWPSCTWWVCTALTLKLGPYIPFLLGKETEKLV